MFIKIMLKESNSSKILVFIGKSYKKEKLRVASVPKHDKTTTRKGKL